jgi:hypothetical protein
MEAIIDSKKTGPLLIVWLFLTSTAPFIFFRWPGHPYKLLTLVCVFIMALHLFNFRQIKGYDFKIFFIIVLQVIYYLSSSLIYVDPTNINLVIQLFSLFIAISYIRFFIGFSIFVKSIIYAIFFMAVGGTIIFFLHFLFGLTPIFAVNYGEDISSFFLLTTTNVFINTDNLRILRYSGFFDEPGNFALYSMFSILLNKIYFNNRKIEIALIFLTLFTFSMAFYFTIIIYFLLFYLDLKKLIYIIPLLILLPISFMLLKKVDSDAYDVVSKMTIERFTETQSDLSETNRGDLMEKDYKTFINNPFFGVGNSEGAVAGANFYAIFAKYGLFGSLFFYSFLIYILVLALKKRSKTRIFYLKILIIILISFFHRPELSSVFTLLIFYSIIYHMRFSKSLNLNVT